MVRNVLGVRHNSMLARHLELLLEFQHIKFVYGKPVAF